MLPWTCGRACRWSERAPSAACAWPTTARRTARHVRSRRGAPRHRNRPGRRPAGSPRWTPASACSASSRSTVPLALSARVQRALVQPVPGRNRECVAPICVRAGGGEAGGRRAGERRERQARAARVRHPAAAHAPQHRGALRPLHAALQHRCGREGVHWERARGEGAAASSLVTSWGRLGRARVRACRWDGTGARTGGRRTRALPASPTLRRPPASPAGRLVFRGGRLVPTSIDLYMVLEYCDQVRLFLSFLWECPLPEGLPASKAALTPHDEGCGIGLRAPRLYGPGCRAAARDLTLRACEPRWRRQQRRPGSERMHARAAVVGLRRGTCSTCGDR